MFEEEEEEEEEGEGVATWVCCFALDVTAFCLLVCLFVCLFGCRSCNYLVQLLCYKCHGFLFVFRCSLNYCQSNGGHCSYITVVVT